MATKTKKSSKAKVASKKTAKATPTKPETKAPAPASKAAKKPAAKKSDRLSAIDAAAQVLQKARKPMRTKEMIGAMLDQGLWSSPAGKTPHATLYSAILREISTKGAQARFKKVERGQFEYRG